MAKPTNLQIAKALEATANKRNWGNGATCPMCNLFDSCKMCTTVFGQDCITFGQDFNIQMTKHRTKKKNLIMNAEFYWEGWGTTQERHRFRTLANKRLRAIATKLRKKK